MARMARDRSLESAAMATKQGTYAEASIRVLKGLEPVKQRPGMYTRTDNPLHVIQEVIDNAADEALAGFGKRIALTLHADGSISVDDDGRGIPFGLHPEEQVPVVEIVFTRLHAGGKFDKGAGGAYSFSGGLHGVGVSVTNALAKRLQVTVWRDGQVATLAFGGGDVIEPLALRKAAAGERKQGTCVRVWPDAKYFDSAELPRHELMHLLRSKAVLMPGVTVTLTQEKVERDPDLALQGRPARLPEPAPGRRAADPAVRRRAVRHRQRDRELRRRRGRGLVRGLHRGRRHAARELCQPDPHAGGRHARGRAEGRPVRRDQGLHRAAFAGPQGREADARGRVLARQLRAQRQGAGPAVPGPDQGAAEQPRRAAAGVVLRQAGAGAVAEPACGVRQEAGRPGDPPGADASARHRRRSRSARAPAWPCCPAS